jgi:hypothetical protein
MLSPYEAALSIVQQAFEFVESSGVDHQLDPTLAFLQKEADRLSDLHYAYREQRADQGYDRFNDGN